MHNFRKGFTLVELIVVIVILSILWTIAFVSFQGYGKESRNTKRISDIGVISRAIIFETNQSVNIMHTVSEQTENIVPNIRLWWDIGTGAWMYTAWIPNYNVLDMNKWLFIDPNGKEYRVWVTLYGWGRHQVTANIEWDASQEIVKIVGDYFPRTKQESFLPLLDTGSTVVTIEQNTMNIYKVYDTINYTASWYTTPAQIQFVSGDKIKLTLNQPIATWALEFILDESPWLIDAKWLANGFVLENTSTTAY